MKKSLPLRLLPTFKNTEPSTLSVKSFRKGGGGGGWKLPSLEEANGNVPLEGVAFSRMD